MAKTIALQLWQVDRSFGFHVESGTAPYCQNRANKPPGGS